MTEAVLPHRAKPALLHEICSHIGGRGQATRSEIYDRFDENRKTLRRTLDYGVHLGFLEEDDNNFELTQRGSGLAYKRHFEGDEEVHDIFREAIEGYGPYREAIAGAYAADKIGVVKESAAVLKDDFRELLHRSVGEEVEDREVNVLIKTAAAAGLGEYTVGRRKYQTRLVLSDEFESYASELAERFPLPADETEGEEGDSEPKNGEDTSEPSEGDVEPEGDPLNGTGSETMQQPYPAGEGHEETDVRTVKHEHVHVHIWAEDEEEADSLLEKFREGGE